ncbi:hypothetical protein EJ08DRAFT_682070 [Tothia fuscella]|uniref:F-box domain-containing protein n=1 Tax=Tothia fuscella TaxID=1048955 RepID=A0A9P4TU50_9PEZI|nr:hypothetical protein EJ08DRAFT_682070 [Tothia fuscella]
MSRPSRSEDDSRVLMSVPQLNVNRQQRRRRSRATATSAPITNIPTLTPQTSMTSLASSNSLYTQTPVDEEMTPDPNTPPSPSLSSHTTWDFAEEFANLDDGPTRQHPDNQGDDPFGGFFRRSASRPISSRPLIDRAQSDLSSANGSIFSLGLSINRQQNATRRAQDLQSRRNRLMEAQEDELADDDSDTAESSHRLHPGIRGLDDDDDWSRTFTARRLANSQNRTGPWQQVGGPRSTGPARPTRRSYTHYLGDDINLPPSATERASAAAAQSLEDQKYPAAFLYSIEPAPTGSDVWPDMRDYSKVPAKFTSVEMPNATSKAGRAKERAAQNQLRKNQNTKDQHIHLPVNVAPVWPKGELPNEIYYLIADHLSRDDVKAMRLTCREFKHHISCILFRTVVVPFNTEIYGMLQGTGAAKIDIKGKGKQKPNEVGFWKNSKGDDLYTGYGIDVFRSFGPRMKKFGMSFEVDEEALANPPLKSMRQAHKSYWGEYSWPFPEYQRFEQVAGLEDAADETPRMKNAFSLLGEVKELALSLDSGLGWISGPDQSIRSRILRRQTSVFGTKHAIPERKIQAQRELWHHLKKSCSTNVDLRHSAFFHRQISQDRNEFTEFGKGFNRASAPFEMPFIDIQPLIDPTLTDFNTPSAFNSLPHPDTPLDPEWDHPDAMLIDSLAPFSAHQSANFTGGMMVVKEDSSDHERFDQYPINPNALNKLQKEWLLETEWAQRAFLSSYLVAIVDSRSTFYNVHTLNFAHISSRFLHSLSRNDFWNALPNVCTVNLQVIADWRDVLKDNAGFVDTPRIALSGATFSFQKLLVEMIAPRRNIKNLKIGWSCGGEHARGLHARNKHLMPAPFLPQEWLTSVETMTNNHLLEQRMLEFRHIEELTLKNCWMPPHALVSLVKKHEGLVKLTLESVSLTAPLVLNVNAAPQNFANPGVPPPPMPPQLNGQNALHGAGLMAVNAAQQAQLVAATNFALPHFANAGGPPPPPAQNQVPGAFFGAHRAGSWPHVLDTISPGVTLASHGSTSSPLNIVATNKNAKLASLTLISCGYALLNSPRLDESAIQPPQFGGGSPWFTKRFQALGKVMMSSKCAFLAEIVQNIPPTEVQAIETCWDGSMGRVDAVGMEEEDGAEGPWYDGFLAGGTGRFNLEVGVESRRVVDEDDL